MRLLSVGNRLSEIRWRISLNNLSDATHHRQQPSKWPLSMRQSAGEASKSEAFRQLLSAIESRTLDR